MGLDQYAYSAAKKGAYNEFWDNAQYDETLEQFVNPNAVQPKELAYWRKHPSLHGWFKQEWERTGRLGDFNGDELEITWEMLDRLEQVVKDGALPKTSGFFFGDGSDEYYKQQDLAFIKAARADLFLGLKVFYNSSW